MTPSAALTTLDFIDLHYREKLGVLAGRWLRPVTATELQQGYEAALQAALPTRTRYWLFDLRGRGPASEDDTHWVLTQFVPRLARRFKGRAYLAFLVGPGQLSPDEQESGSPMVQDEVAHVRLFAAEEPAVSWLNGRQNYEST